MSKAAPVSESSTYFHHLREFVNGINAGCQIQAAKALRNPAGEWSVILDLYPDFRQAFFLRSAEGQLLVGRKAPASDRVPAAHPLLLYLKSHFVGHRIEAAQAPDEKTLVFTFKGSGRKLTFVLDKFQLRAELQVPDRKTYRVELKLETWTPELATASNTQESAATTPALTGGAKLRAKLEEDLREARERLAWLEPLLKLVEVQKDLWADGKNIPPELRAIIEKFQTQQKLPPFARASVAKANELLFNWRKRYARKVAHVAARLGQSGDLRLRKPGSRSTRQNGAGTMAGERASGSAPPAEAKNTKALARKKPGIWVELQENLWARVGRSATENDELFRQARDRDLWFHVRALAGAHVWIPRGQAALSAKGEVPPYVLELGRMLALFNSKARAAGAAEVDESERRNLKKIPREPGKLKILRSKVVHTRLAPEFERKWGGK